MIHCWPVLLSKLCLSVPLVSIQTRKMKKKLEIDSKPVGECLHPEMHARHKHIRTHIHTDGQITDTRLTALCLGIQYSSSVHVTQTRLNSHSTPQSVDAYRSSPCRAFSMASGSCDRNKSCVTTGDPRHRVDRRLITVDMLGLDLESAGDTTTGPKTQHMNILIYK